MFSLVHEPHRAPRRVIGVCAAAGVLALLLAGCTSPPNADAGSESAAQQAAFSEYYDQEISWGECNDDFGISADAAKRMQEAEMPIDRFECGHVSAPIDWADPENTESISLAVNRLPAEAETSAGALLVNPGGPGGSGFDLALSMSTVAEFSGVMQQYDLVGFDPRGIARSTPIECDIDSNIPEVQISLCADENPLALTMGTSQVARDMDLLRHLSSDPELHYLGYSYGTMLGATYATIFPERVGRMVLDSAESAHWAGLEGSFDQQVAIVDATQTMLDECENDFALGRCPLPDAATRSAQIATLDEQPLVATDGFEVDSTGMYTFLTSALYGGAASRAISLDMAGSALSGEQDGIDAVAQVVGSGGANVGLAGTIVRCHSFPADADVPGLIAHVKEAGVPEELGGPEITDEVLRKFIDLGCDAMPVSGDDITDTFTNTGDSTILVMGVTGDHATPYTGAQQLTEELGNARLLTLEGQGHGASFANRSTCADAAATQYLLEGELPAEGTVCTDD
ncbi:alpha/beta hydrolase [Leucobacter japonicus]|uniref:alpha/beta hydrolase n=1 Tax=Leucobacter japonicus TaxID=1461259 RepID=UPI0006A76B91|nr:alpha/beta hydrolase [Leucobacter japonicus]